MAAANHDRAAEFWVAQGDRDRAGLQHEMAEYERLGASLESRWAELLQPNHVPAPIRAAESHMRHAHQGARQLSAVLLRTAEALDRSAELAEKHAVRREEQGRTDDVDEERRVAARTRQAAQRARTQAEEWLKTSKT
jgi:hypothetical protein